MPYNSLISRTDAAALIPEETVTETLRGARQQSAVLQLFRRVNVSRAQQRFPVLSALPVAYWVTGDTGLIQTTEEAWANKFINIEEVACIVPLPKTVLDDADFDIWAEVRPDLEEAVGRTIDSAVFFGANAPGTFPTNIVAAAIAAGNVVNIGATVAEGGFHDDLDEAFGLVEADGYDVSGIAAARGVRGRLRRARNTQGDRLNGANDTFTEYGGVNIAYPARGLWPTGAGAAEALVGAFDSNFVVAVRRDMTYSLSDEAVITDNTGAVIYNLWQQEMMALKVTMRLGWQVSNPINVDQPVEANRYPVAVVRVAPV